MTHPLRPYFCRRCGVACAIPTWRSGSCEACGSGQQPVPWISQSANEQSTVTVTNTRGFLALMADSATRNRGPIEAIGQALCPYGVHLVVTQMHHNGLEWRSQWYVKLSERDSPLTVWMDNSYQAFADFTLRGVSLETLKEYRAWLHCS